MEARPISLTVGDIARFYNKFSVTPECWVWMAGLNKDGYGTFSIGKRKLLAHRVSYAAAKGDIPKGLCVDHLCRNTCCVNPDHLEAVTHAENVYRGAVGEVDKAKTHCPKGHEYSGRNLVVIEYKLKSDYQGTNRRCRACLYASAENARIKRKERWENGKTN